MSLRYSRRSKINPWHNNSTIIEAMSRSLCRHCGFLDPDIINKPMYGESGPMWRGYMDKAILVLKDIQGVVEKQNGASLDL